VFPIHIPPLREHHEDISLLAKHLLEKACNEQKKKLDGFAPEVMDLLVDYPWPGNVRELKNSINLAVALAEEDKQVQTYHFPPQITQGESLLQEILSERIGLPAAMERLQRRLIENALRECDGNHTQAAKLLGLQRSNFIRLMRRLGID
jgi:DNA-binding NtrC family response regulator